MPRITTEVASTPAEFKWIAEQNPELDELGWRDIAAAAGDIVCSDMLGGSRLHLGLLSIESCKSWEVCVFIDGYTDHADLSVSLNDILNDIDGATDEPEDLDKLVHLLRQHADRIEASRVEWNGADKE
jgi:hypothetical protein